MANDCTMQMGGSSTHWVAVVAITLSIVAATTGSITTNVACPNVVWDGRQNRRYAQCAELGSQGARLAYSYNSRTRLLEAAFTGQLSTGRGWVGWGINPSSWGMMGSSALVAFRAANGSTVLPYKLSPAAIRSKQLRCSPVDLAIRPASLGVYITASGSVSIFAALTLQSTTSINVIWNRGPSVVNFSPQPHTLLSNDLHGFTSLDVSF